MVSSVVVSGGKRGSKGKVVEEKPAKRMRTDSGRATYAQPVPTKSKGKVQVQYYWLYHVPVLCQAQIPCQRRGWQLSWCLQPVEDTSQTCL